MILLLGGAWYTKVAPVKVGSSKIRFGETRAGLIFTEGRFLRGPEQTILFDFFHPLRGWQFWSPEAPITWSPESNPLREG